MTMFLVFAVAGFVLIAAGIDSRRTRKTVVAEILAAEQRQIARERNRGLDANIAARWSRD